MYVSFDTLYFLNNLAVNVKNAQEADKPGVTALLFNELTGRLQDDDLDLADAAEIETYRSLGKALSVDETVSYDPVQSRYVMHPSLSNQLRAYQQDHKELNPTGKIDYMTLRSLSGRNIGPFLSGVRSF